MLRLDRMKFVLFLAACAVPLVPCPGQQAAPKPPAATSPRDTTTGRVFENMVEAALKSGGYAVEHQKPVGTRPNGGRHIVDLIARKNGRAVLVSLKWQQAAGTAEQKIPYEIICLAEIMEQTKAAANPADRYPNACIVLGGSGWTLREWYLSGALEKHLPAAKSVPLYDLETFISRANQGKL